MSKLPILVALAVGLAGCAARAPNLPPVVPDGIEKRTGHPVRPLEQRPDGALPAGVSLADGVTEEEAVAVALWNNAKLAADLAGLGVARADLIEAATWRNPTLQMLFPVGLKPFELALTYPLEVFWQRPKRMEAARKQWDQLAESLVQNGLDTARDARQAQAALVQAQERARVAREAADLGRQIAQLTEARLRAGDISELDADMVRARADMVERAGAPRDPRYADRPAATPVRDGADVVAGPARRGRRSSARSAAAGRRPPRDRAVDAAGPPRPGGRRRRRRGAGEVGAVAPRGAGRDSQLEGGRDVRRAERAGPVDGDPDLPHECRRRRAGRRRSRTGRAPVLSAAAAGGPGGRRGASRARPGARVAGRLARPRRAVARARPSRRPGWPSRPATSRFWPCSTRRGSGPTPCSATSISPRRSVVPPPNSIAAWARR